MNDVVCASSVEQLEAKIPKYFDRDYVQHVDGKTIGYDEFVEHMKVLHGKIKDVSVRWRVPPGSGQAPWLILAGGRRETSHSVRGLLERPKGSFRHTITHLQLH